MNYLHTDSTFVNGTVESFAQVADGKISLESYIETTYAENWEHLRSYHVASSRAYLFVDQDDDYVYACAYDGTTSPQISVEKFQKSDMTRVAYYSSTNLGSLGIVVHGDYVYVAFYVSNKLIKLNKSDLSYVGEIAITTPKGCLLDNSGDYIYVQGRVSNYQRLYSIRLSDFTSLGYKQGHYYDSFDFMWQDDDYVYHNVRTINTCVVGRYAKDLSTYAEISFSGTSVYSYGGFCYDGYCYVAALYGTSTRIYKHSTSTWSGTGTLITTYSGYDDPRAMVFDGTKYAYLTLLSSPGKVFRILFSDWTNEGITFATNHNSSYFLSLGSDHLVAGCTSSSYGSIELIEIRSTTNTTKYKTSGAYISEELAITNTNFYLDSLISQEKTGTVVLKARVSKDGKASWSDYATLTTAFTQFEAGESLDDCWYQIRLELSGDGNSTPEVDSISIYIEEYIPESASFLIHSTEIPLIGVMDDSLNLQYEYDDYTYAKWENFYQDTDKFEFRIDRQCKGTEYLLQENILLFPTAVPGVYKTGIIQDRELEFKKNSNTEEWSIKGYSVEKLLEDRLVMNFGSDGYARISEAAETCIKFFIRENCITPSNTDRILDHFMIAADRKRGEKIDASGRLESVLEIVKKFCVLQGFGFHVYFDMGTKKFIFDLLVGRNLAYSTIPGTDYVLFSKDLENLQGMKYAESTAHEKTCLILGNADSGTGRTFTEKIAEGKSKGWLRKEMLVDTKSCKSQADVDNLANNKIEEKKASLSLELDIFSEGVFQLDRDFFLGDIITGYYDEVAMVSQRITGITEEIKNKSREIKFILGKEKADLFDVIKWNSDMSELRR